MAEKQTAGDAVSANGSTIHDPSHALEWRCIGPHRGGRVVAVAGHPTEFMTFYFGAVGGGVWKTIDGGNFWENVSDGYFGTAAVGALAVAESDPNVIYAGTGESTIRGNVSHGDGVYKSTDGGKTWTNVGLADTRHISKIRVHPQNPDLVYVAALGHAWGPNGERGVYRSRDGGQNWERVLFRSERAGAIDLSMDPNNPRTLYAATWEVQRWPWTMSSGGPGSGIFKSTDGGDTWTELTDKEGLPKGVKGKIGIAVSPAKPDRVWALVEAKDGALFRSDDGGETWQRLSEEPGLRMRAWYYMHIFADPQDSDTCWVLNLACWRSTDGGRTFSNMPTPHGDNHDLWLDPRNPQRAIEGNDGGACVSFNGGWSWSSLWNQPTAQFYHVTADDAFPYRVYGSQQDNSAISLPNASVQGAIASTEWFVPGGGESGYIAIKPDDPNIIVGGAIGSGAGNGLMTVYDHRTGHERAINVWPETTGMGEGADALKYRFQWTFPISFSPHDPNVLYAAANCLFRSTDVGGSWEAISPDLTRNDRSKMEASGGPITKDNTGVEVYGTIFAFEESPHQAGLFWVGTDDGLVQLSRDGGRTWEEITPPELKTPEAEWALISIIHLSAHDPGTAYLAATRYKHDDSRPYLYKTSDYGKSWKRITNGIPDHDFTRVIREDPNCRGLLYAGTETGLYISYNDGESWERFGGNLPVTPIHDLIVKDRDLVVATHGRSFWILDDLTPLYQIKEGGHDASKPRLFQPRPTVRFLTYGWWWYDPNPGEQVHYAWAGPVGIAYRQRKKANGQPEVRFLDAGKNPPPGAIVTYYLPEKPEGDITLRFLDAGGNEIRSFTSKPPKTDGEEAGDGAETPHGGAEGSEEAMTAAVEDELDKEEPRIPKEAGMNRFVWNMRYPDAHKIPEDKSLGFLLPGPWALPGTYSVELTVNGETQTQTFEVVKDPRTRASQEDLQRQFDLLIQARDALSRTHDAVKQIREIKGQVESWENRLKKREDAKPILEAATALKKSLSEVEDELIQVKGGSPLQPPEKLNAKLSALPFFADFVDSAPSRQVYDVYEDLSGRLNTQLDRLRAIIDTDVAAFNQQILEANLPVIAPVTSLDQ